MVASAQKSSPEPDIRRSLYSVPVKAPAHTVESYPYRLELLPTVPAYHRRARIGKHLAPGELVYYGPMPVYYGIGEVKRIAGGFVAVDFRGTGRFGVHEDVLEYQYLIPLPAAARTLI